MLLFSGYQQAMTSGRSGNTPTILGAIVGTALVAFVALLAVFLRDVALSGHACGIDPREGWRGVVLEVCLKRARAAAGRLWWEVPALVLAGGLIGAVVARWRQSGHAMIQDETRSAGPLRIASLSPEDGLCSARAANRRAVEGNKMKIEATCPWCGESQPWGMVLVGKETLTLTCRCKALGWVTASPDPNDGQLQLWVRVMGKVWPKKQPASRKGLEREVEFREADLPVKEASRPASAAGYRWRVVWARRRPPMERATEDA